MVGKCLELAGICSKQLNLVKESNYPAKFKSLSHFPILETTPFGVDLILTERDLNKSMQRGVFYK